MTTIFEFRGGEPVASAIAAEFATHVYCYPTAELNALIQKVDTPIMRWFHNHKHPGDQVWITFDIPPDMEWLDLHGKWDKLDYYLLTFEFQDPAVAMLFKLTWK